MAEPTPKAPVLASLLDRMANRTASIQVDKCIPAPLGCGGDAVEFRDALSEKEYRISGLCQKCQDSVFGTGDE